MWDRIDSMSECLVSRSELLSTDVYIQALATFLWFVLFLTKRGQGKLKKVCTHCLGNVLAVKQNVLKWRPNHSQNVIWREIASFVPHWKWNFAFLVGQKIFPYQYTVFRFYQANKKIVTYTCLYCAFHKHANSEVQKPTDDCFFRCRQSS